MTQLVRPKPDLTGLLALDERYVDRVAAGAFSPVARMLLDDPGAPYERRGNTAIVTIEGPLLQYGGWWWDGHEAAKGRLMAAIGDPQVSHIGLVIDSPGGMCAGLYDACRAVLDAKVDSGKGITTYAREEALSAGYCWGCVADEIWMPDTGYVASVGCLSMMVDLTEAAAAAGVKPYVVRSGKRKAEGHPLVGITPEAISAEQERVDVLAGLFAEFVASSRGMTAADVLGHEGAYYLGAQGVEKGFANGLMSYGGFLAYVEEKGRKKRMKSMLGALGLSADASEERGKEAIEALKKSAANAAARAEKAEADVAAAVERCSTVLLDGAVREGRILTAQRESKLRIVTENRNGPVLGLQRLDEDLAACPKGAALPAPLKEPKDAPKRGASSADKWAGKTYAQLSNMDRAALKREDPELFNKLRAESKNPQQAQAN